MAHDSQLKPRRKPRQARARATVDAILEAAAQVFERHGYAAGTTNRIAKRAGVSIGSLYEYFASKDAIVMELARRHIETAAAIVFPALALLVDAQPPLGEGLDQIVWGMVALHRATPRLHDVLFEQSPRSPEIQSMRIAFFERTSDLIADYLRTCPEARVGDPCVAGRMVAQTVDGVTHGLAIQASDDGELDRYAKETVAMLESYLTR